MACGEIIIIIIISTTMFMVLSSWQSHCESSHSRDNTAVDRTTVCSLCVIQKDGVSVRLQVRSYAIL